MLTLTLAAGAVAIAAVAALIVTVARMRDAKAAAIDAAVSRGTYDERARQAEADLNRERLETVQARVERMTATERAEALQRRIAELEAELAEERSSPLRDRLVSVNTPRPDDQTLRGVVLRELPDGGLLLGGAVVLETVVDGRGGAQVVESPAGDVVVPAYAWAQRLPDPDEQQEA